MYSKELRNLHKAYLDVYVPQEVDEAVKGASRHDTEMRKAASTERKSGIKNRLSPAAGKDNADKMQRDVKFFDKLTKKNRNVVGLVTKEEVEELDESGLPQDTIQRAVKERQKRVDVAYAKDTPEGDAEGKAGMKKLRRSKSQLDINKPREVRMRANEEVEQIDELSVNKMNAYINKAEKDRGRLNKKWDQGTATSKERKKVFDREEGEARASKKIRQKTGKDSFRLNALDKLKSAITKEEVEIFDVVLEYLVAEGYADTNESALVIMANMSEEWRQSIVG